MAPVWQNKPYLRSRSSCRTLISLMIGSPTERYGHGTPPARRPAGLWWQFGGEGGLGGVGSHAENFWKFITASNFTHAGTRSPGNSQNEKRMINLPEFGFCFCTLPVRVCFRNYPAILSTRLFPNRVSGREESRHAAGWTGSYLPELQRSLSCASQ